VRFHVEGKESTKRAIKRAQITTKELTRRTQASEVRSLKTQLKFAESAICEHQTRADDAELQV
jgi:hypothetical protein